MCAAFDGLAVQEELVAEFVGGGLKRRERVVYFAGDDSRERVLDMLKAGGLATAEPVAQGQLMVIPASEGYLSQPQFDPDGMIAVLNASIDDALADGYSGFCATGELPRGDRDVPAAELLTEYELKVGEICAARPTVGLCQYDRALAGRPLVNAMCGLHDHVVRNPLISENELLRILPLMDDPQGNSRFRVGGEADLSNSALLMAMLHDGRLGSGDLHLDLGRLRFIDLRGVEALRELTDELRSLQRRLVLHNSPSTLGQIVEVLGDCLQDVEMSAP